MKDEEITRMARLLVVDQAEVKEALKYLQTNPVLSRMLAIRFDDAIAEKKNTLETIPPEGLQKTQGIIAGLKQGQGIIKGESEQ